MSKKRLPLKEYFFDNNTCFELGNLVIKYKDKKIRKIIANEFPEYKLEKLFFGKLSAKEHKKEIEGLVLKEKYVSIKKSNNESSTD